MTTVLHFFKRDVRRASLLYFIWFLLFASDGLIALSASPSNLNATNLVTGLAMNSLLFSFLKILVLSVLVPQLVQEDPLVGSTAFWMTRPVSRGMLLWAKMAGLSLVVSIPLLVNAVVLTSFGLSVADLGGALTEVLIFQLMIIIPITLVSAVTPNFARFAVVSVAVVAGLGVLLALIPTPVAGSLGGGPLVDAALVNTRFLIQASLLIVGGGLIVAFQFLTRRTDQSIVLATCLAGVCLIVVRFWAWNLMQDEPLRSSPAVLETAKITAQINPSQLNNSPYSFLSGSLGKNIDGSCSLRGISPEVLYQIRRVRPRLTTTNGVTIKTLGAIPTLSFNQIDENAAFPIAAALDGIPVYRHPSSGTSTTFVTVDNATFLQSKDLAVKLEVELDLVVSRYERVAEIPLVVGGRYDHGSVHMKINELAPRADGITIVVVESSVNLMFSPSDHASRQPTDPRYRGDAIYLLMNRGRREAALVNPGITHRSAVDIRLGGQIIQKVSELAFGKPWFEVNGNPPAPVINEQWLAAATLVRLERIPIAEFSKTVAVEIAKLGEPWQFRSTGNRTTLP